MTLQEFRTAARCLNNLHSAIRHTLFPLHYTDLLNRARDKVLSIARFNNFNPAAIRELVNHEFSVYTPNSFYMMIPNLSAYGMDSDEQMNLIADWLDLPRPEPIVYPNIVEARSELSTLKPYTLSSIVSTYPTLNILFKLDDAYPTGRYRHVRKPLTNLLSLCTTAMTLLPNPKEAAGN